MRQSLLIGGVVSLGAIMAVACGSSNTNGAPDDAGSSGSSGTSGTSGASGTSGTSGTSGSSGDPDGGGDGGGDNNPQLKAGDVSLIGVTNDSQVVYTVKGTGTTHNIEAVPLAGGAPATLGTVADDNDISLAGNTVAFWTAVDATGVGTINLWTKAGGVKANVATQSVPGLISSSEDGSKIAFTLNSPADTADIAITTPGAPSVVANATTALLPNVNVVSPACSADFGFVGKTFFSGHCTGPGNGAGALTKASLVEVADLVTPTVKTLVDGAAAAGINAIRPQWSPDKTGTHLLVFALTAGAAANQARVLTRGSGAPTVTNIENNAASGFLSDDGTKVFYRTTAPAAGGGTPNAFRSAPALANNATPNNPPAGAITLVASPGYPSTINVSPDKTHVLFRKLAVVGAKGEVPRVDINLIDTTTAAQTGAALVATATGFPGGFTSTGTHVIYLTELSAQGIGKLKVRPVAAAGVERDVASGAGLPRPLPGGTRAVFFNNPKQAGQGVSIDLQIFDVAGTAAPKPVVTAIDPFFEIAGAGTKVVYTRPGATGGLYAAVLP